MPVAADRKNLKKFVKTFVGDKGILDTEFKSMLTLFKSAGVNSNKININQHNEQIINSIITSLVIYYEERGKSVFEESDEEKLKEQIRKAIKYGKESFAYMAKNLNKEDK
jgi:hypothetical protein